MNTCPEPTRLMNTTAHPSIEVDKGAEGQEEEEEGGKLVEREVL